MKRSIYFLFVLFVSIACQKEPPPKPIAKFEAVFVSADVSGATYSFKNTSQNATTYSWAFGDGGKSADHSPLYKFKQNGSYEITLDVTGDGGTDTYKTVINIINIPVKPVARFEPIFVVVDRTGATYSFKNTTQNASSYNWSFGDGGSSSDASPVYKYKQNGVYDVVLTAKGDGGTDTFKQTVRISNIPTTGNFMFWTRIGDMGNITINVAGSQAGIITVYQTSSDSPLCNAQGFVTLTLPEGTYSYTAKSQGLFPLNWSGTFQVINGTCRTLQLTR
ncbi:MAG: PKD domain-containing protein [Bacteroidetes bacterium]|nr:PKD domain-containing protein [Bacteroidota bacterium]